MCLGKHNFSFSLLGERDKLNNFQIRKRNTRRQVNNPRSFHVAQRHGFVWVWDPGSEILDAKNAYSGSRIEESKRHPIPDPDSVQNSYILWKKESHSYLLERHVAGDSKLSHHSSVLLNLLSCNSSICTFLIIN
jgi:hypothetical protein